MQKLHQVMLLHKYGVITRTPLKENCFAKTYFLYDKFFCMTQSKHVMVFCFQNLSDPLREKKNSDLEELLKFEAEAENLQKF